MLFADNVIHNNRARGALFSTPKKTIAENNLFDHTSILAILLCGDCNMVGIKQNLPGYNYPLEKSLCECTLICFSSQILPISIYHKFTVQSPTKCTFMVELKKAL